MSLSSYPTLLVKSLNSEADIPSDTSLRDIHATKNPILTVLDFWHTKCVKCPAALDKLNTEATNYPSQDVLFISCALSQGDGNFGVAEDVVLGFVLKAFKNYGAPFLF